MISHFNDTNEEGQLALWRWEEHVVFAIHANESISIDHTLALTAPMGNAQSRTAESYPPLPNIRFRVLVIGRANAGKTSILQRVCETTESPIVFRGGEEVHRPSFCLTSRVLLPILGYT